MRLARGESGLGAKEVPCGQETLVLSDPASHALAQLLVRIAPSDLPILIRGETGTGKGMMARYIHEVSGRAGPFLTVNCSAVDGIGQADADPRHANWFEAAAGGTLFLDEIADLPMALQPKLLCALQHREANRACPRQNSATDVRLVAATRLDLDHAVSMGRFRADLLYRLNTAQVTLLPLRQRMDDVEALADHFIRSYAKALQAPVCRLTADARAALVSYSWPGNVRELENAIRFALLVAPTRELRREHLGLPAASQPDQQRVLVSLHADSEEPSTQTLSGLLGQLFQDPGRRLLERLEGQVVEEAFRFTGKNQVRTAALLGISRNVLRTLLKKHGLYEVRAYASTDAESARHVGSRRPGG